MMNKIKSKMDEISLRRCTTSPKRLYRYKVHFVEVEGFKGREKMACNNTDIYTGFGFDELVELIFPGKNWRDYVRTDKTAFVKTLSALSSSDLKTYYCIDEEDKARLGVDSLSLGFYEPCKDSYTWGLMDEVFGLKDLSFMVVPTGSLSTHSSLWKNLVRRVIDRKVPLLAHYFYDPKTSGSTWNEEGTQWVFYHDPRKG